MITPLLFMAAGIGLALDSKEFWEMYSKQGKDREDILTKVSNGTANGVFALRNISKHAILCEYAGTLLENYPEGIKNEGSLYEFTFHNRQHWIDDTGFEDRLCYAIRNDAMTPNAEMEIREYEGIPHLWLVALEDIPKGKEIRYNQGLDEDELTPSQEQLEVAGRYVLENRDREDLEIRIVNPEIGRGIFATKAIAYGEFLCDYCGQFYETFDENITDYTYVYEFDLENKTYWINAAEDDGRKCRLVNDNHIDPNTEMQVHEFNGTPYLWLFAIKNIEPDEELRFNYGPNQHHWRDKDKQACVDYLPPKNPREVALDFVTNDFDTDDLEVLEVDPTVGRGVFANQFIETGEYICHYTGKLLESEPSGDFDGGFIFEIIKPNGHLAWLNATEDDGSVCRFVNDDHLNPNADVTVEEVNGQSYLVLYALRNIFRGEEIRYEYSGENFKWRMKVHTPESTQSETAFEMAQRYIRAGKDREDLVIDVVDPFTGFGVFSTVDIKEEEFICDFSGVYQTEMPCVHSKDYWFEFAHLGKTFWIDAYNATGRVCRLVNDCNGNPNAYGTVHVVDGRPHVLIMAKENIPRGTEIRYSYGSDDFWWRKCNYPCDRCEQIDFIQWVKVTMFRNATKLYC